MDNIAREERIRIDRAVQRVDKLLMLHRIKRVRAEAAKLHQAKKDASL